MIEPRKYRFHTDKQCYIWSALHLLFIGAVALTLGLNSGASYLTAWLLSLIIAIFGLMTISIPRYLYLDEFSITINCVLDVVSIPIDEIVYIRKVSPRKIRWVLPLYGSCGYFGYFGYFFDCRGMERIKIHATEWSHLVEIVDIYEERHYISCRGRDKLIAQIEQIKAGK